MRDTKLLYLYECLEHAARRDQLAETPAERSVTAAEVAIVLEQLDIHRARHAEEAQAKANMQPA